MNVIHLFLLILVMAANGKQTPPDARVVGGEHVKDRTKFAYQVSLRVGNQHICGGVIYDDRHILTAAHCVVNRSPSDYMIMAGNLDYSLPSLGMEIQKPAHFFTHERYNTKDCCAFDIAVIRTKERFHMTRYVKPIPLWDSATPPTQETSCILSGWGNSHIGGVTSKALQWAEVFVMDSKTCDFAYEDLIKPGMLCAGVMEGGIGACQGDSGGPLVCNGKLTGLVSWSFDCARPSYPTVYTNVTYYIPWIRTQIARSSSNKFAASSLLITIIFFMNK